MTDFTKQHNYLVAFDSDGCVFDTMELKHKECFIPNIIKYYHLQAVSKYAREAAEFVNLYSKSRGINRFPALIETLEWLAKRPEVIARGVNVEVPPALRDWVSKETKLGNPALKQAVQSAGDPVLTHALKWSEAVNDDVTAMVENVPPFPKVRECLEKLAGVADMIVCSATPTKNLELEWREHGIESYVAGRIYGQEAGTKKEILRLAPRYGADKVLMVGDAPGDYQAAKANNCLFYPINPGAEEVSWERLHNEALDRFLTGAYAGQYQEGLLREFESYLPERPKFAVLS